MNDIFDISKPKPSLCDNCFLAYSLPGIVGMGENNYKQRYCSALKIGIHTDGKQNCNRYLPIEHREPTSTTNSARDTRHDAQYDITTGEWLETVCGNVNCDFCRNRPDKHYE